MRPRVLVTNWASADNLGDLAILKAQVEYLEQDLGAEVAILGCGPAVVPPEALANRYVGGVPWPAPWEFGVLPWLRGCVLALISLASPSLAGRLSASHAQLVSVISSADVVMPKGGGYFHSNGTLRRWLFLLRSLYPLLLARRLGVRRAAWGHSIGPLEGNAARVIVRAALTDADIIVRDDASCDVCSGLGLTARRAPDFAVLTKAGGGTPGDAAAHANGVCTVGVTAKRVSRDPAVQADYVRAMRHSLYLITEAASADGKQVVFEFIPQVVGPTRVEDDRPVLREIAAGLQEETVRFVTRPYDLSGVLAIYAGLEFLVATRLHSAILAACPGTPSAIFSYIGGKAGGFVKDIGLPEWVTTGSVEEFPETVRRCFEARVGLRRRLAPGLAQARRTLKAVACSLPEDRTHRRNGVARWCFGARGRLG